MRLNIIEKKHHKQRYKSHVHIGDLLMKMLLITAD